MEVDLPAEAVTRHLALADQLLARRLLRPALERHVRDVLDLFDAAGESGGGAQDAALAARLGVLQRVGRRLTRRRLVLQATTQRR